MNLTYSTKKTKKSKATSKGKSIKTSSTKSDHKNKRRQEEDIVVDLLKLIAVSETAIEKQRLKLAALMDFQPREFFDSIDEEKNRKISLDELQ